MHKEEADYSKDCMEEHVMKELEHDAELRSKRNPRGLKRAQAGQRMLQHEAVRLTSKLLAKLRMTEMEIAILTAQVHNPAMHRLPNSNPILTTRRMLVRGS